MSDGFDEVYVDTRRQLRGVAESLIAGPQYRASGTIRLAVRPDGFAGVAHPDLAVHGTELVLARTAPRRSPVRSARSRHTSPTSSNAAEGNCDATMIATVDESTLIAALRDGDEAAFAQLVDKHAPSMLRVARGYVPSREIAEEVVQETWIALLRGIDNFAGRSSLRTWLFTVMINIAKARGVRERRDADAAIAAFTDGTVDCGALPRRRRPLPGPLETGPRTVAVPGHARGLGARQ